MRKVVFLRVARDSLDVANLHPTALVLQKAADGYLSIQGRTPVAWSERHRCWELFRKAAKSLLGLCETSVVSVCLSEPPNTAINDLVDVFRQPSHVVSLTLSPLPREVEEEEVERRKSSRAVSMDFRGWQHTSGALREQRRGPVASPQASRRPKLSGKEMDKLLAQLDEVSQSLERTQTQCEAIARRCEGRARQLSEDTDDASDDSRVERLLRVAENLTAQIIHQQHLQQQGSPRDTPTPRQPMMMTSLERGAGLPDSPTGVSVQPSLNGGTYVLWNPVRLDGRDRNNGCQVTGYAVYVDRVQRSTVTEPFRSHTEIMGLEHEKQYQIQVSTLAEDCESTLSPPIQYRHEARSPPSPATPPALSPTNTTSHGDQQQARKSGKVENWLLQSSQTLCETPVNTHTSHNVEGPTRLIECQHGGSGRKSDKPLTTPSGSTHLPDDARSVGSSHTSGIVMDLPPCSPKLTPSCPSYHCDGFSDHSETSTVLVDGRSFVNKGSSISPYHHVHFSPSPTPSPFVTPSRARSSTPQGKQMVDTVIDEPLDCTLFSSERERRASATVQLVAGSRHRGPAPPANIQVRCRQPGYVIISWSPIKRDAKGCSNGCFVLGYRVYINGTSQISVDGPMSSETSLRCPHLDSTHKLAVHVRTRAIAAESVSSSTVLFDLLLQESQEQYSGPKVTPAISSTATLCPSNKPHPQAIHKSRNLTASQETYV